MGIVAENGECKKDEPIPKSLASFPLAVREALQVIKPLE